jgi:Uma2 family endonuclease
MHTTAIKSVAADGTPTAALDRNGRNWGSVRLEDSGMVAHQEPEHTSMSVEEYLALVETSQTKYEYVHGYVYAMSGGTVAHDTIGNNVRSALDTHLGNGPCRVLGPDMRVKMDSGIYYYPDALVTCDEAITDAAVDITSPRLIVEVLSDSTEANDRGVKFAAYQTISVFEEYLLVDSRRRAIERFHRTDSNLWIYQNYGMDETVTLETVALTWPVAAFYRRTQL